ncbi:MAG: hypothetical protein M0Q96_03575 [Candidatus Omnitrophica bacterium]|nr:hypothetical protein [Candidatus Omnitrophota bacterium]
MFKKILVLVYLFMLIVFVPNAAAQEMDWEELGGDIFDVRCLFVFPDNKRNMLIGNQGNIFLSSDTGVSWSRKLSLRGKDKKINQILSTQNKKMIIYAATDCGLYASFDNALNWKRIFRGANHEESSSTAIALKGETILVGTKSGLYLSNDNGRNWEKETGELGRSEILNIDVFNGGKNSYIYAATVNGVFKKHNQDNWEKIYSQNNRQDNADQQSQIVDTDQQSRYWGVRYIKSDPENDGLLYLATTRGIYKSLDAGNSWEAVAEYGLLQRDVKYLSISVSGQLFSVTNSGIFVFNQDRWLEQTSSLSAGTIHSLAIIEPDVLLIGADKGVFRSIVSKKSIAYGINSNEISAKEPKINQVQQAAIDYAEVSPEKIKNWRKQAAKKALLPELSVGVERNSTDLWHWETGSSTIGQSGDDSLRRGRDSIDWDVTLRWDLGEIIWNDDQTNIDVRSKLMVELRDDILDQVNKLYFERLRVKMELGNLNIEDLKKRNEKELKLQELSASLDALTGGYFSRQIEA